MTVVILSAVEGSLSKRYTRIVNNSRYDKTGVTDKAKQSGFVGVKELPLKGFVLQACVATKHKSVLRRCHTEAFMLRYMNNEFTSSYTEALCRVYLMKSVVLPRVPL